MTIFKVTFQAKLYISLAANKISVESRLGLIKGLNKLFWVVGRGDGVRPPWNNVNGEGAGSDRLSSLSTVDSPQVLHNRAIFIGRE